MKLIMRNVGRQARVQAQKHIALERLGPFTSFINTNNTEKQASGTHSAKIEAKELTECVPDAMFS